MIYRYGIRATPTLITPNEKAFSLLKRSLKQRFQQARIIAIQRRMIAYYDARFIIQETFKLHHVEQASLWACKRMDESFVFYAEDRALFDHQVLCQPVSIVGAGRQDITAYELLSNNTILDHFKSSSSFNVEKLSVLEGDPGTRESMIDIESIMNFFQLPNLRESTMFAMSRNHHAYQAAALMLIRQELSARSMPEERRSELYTALIQSPKIRVISEAYADCRLIELPEDYTDSGFNIGGSRHSDSAHAFTLDIKKMIDQA